MLAKYFTHTHLSLGNCVSVDTPPKQETLQPCRPNL